MERFPTDRPVSTSAEVWGTVVSVQANYYQVKLSSPASSSGKFLLCTRRARLKKVGQQVMVGDTVLVEEPDWAGARGAIAAVESRRTQLDRPPVANANQILLVFALAEPSLDPSQLTRFLVKAETTGLRVCLCLNKRDLLSSEEQAAWRDRLSTWGYSPILTSFQWDEAFPELREALTDRITVVSGPSGVGKSSLINRLIPAADLRTNEVSGRLRRGRHTTRHVELFELDDGGLLADTPGFNQPEISCVPERLESCFPEIREFLSDARCQFSDCLHQGEPGCAVPKSWERYPSYLNLLETCKAQHQAINDSTDPDTAFKVKAGDSGKASKEPRLLAKKYRRVSRRSRRQALQDARYELPENLEALEAMDVEDWNDPESPAPEAF